MQTDIFPRTVVFQPPVQVVPAGHARTHFVFASLLSQIGPASTVCVFGFGTTAAGGEAGCSAGGAGAGVTSAGGDGAGGAGSDGGVVTGVVVAGGGVVVGGS